jgi:hypothetical protein
MPHNLKLAPLKLIIIKKVTKQSPFFNINKTEEGLKNNHELDNKGKKAML